MKENWVKVDRETWHKMIKACKANLVCHVVTICEPVIEIYYVRKDKNDFRNDDWYFKVERDWIGPNKEVADKEDYKKFYQYYYNSNLINNQ